MCVGRTEPHPEEGTPPLVGGERGEHEGEDKALEFGEEVRVLSPGFCSLSG